MKNSELLSVLFPRIKPIMYLRRLWEHSNEICVEMFCVIYHDDGKTIEQTSIDKHIFISGMIPREFKVFHEGEIYTAETKWIMKSTSDFNGRERFY